MSSMPAALGAGIAARSHCLGAHAPPMSGQEALESKQAMEEAEANTYEGMPLHGYRSPVGNSAAVTPRGEERSLLEAGQEASVSKL